ncbi:MAG: hypothetical protein JW991_03830 [Candidatus Pacebacteria bacterium]|nr:hypothetical protein [Candidatus Paceibacterota bacterium]
MKRRKDPLFQLASYNWLADNQSMFPNSTFKILLLIFRQTLGFQKEKDFIRYGFIEKKTKYVKATISPAINWLIDNGYIERFDDEENLIVKVKKGSRAMIYYRLSDFLYQELDNYFINSWNSTGPKIGTVTNPETGTYKEKEKQIKVSTNNKYIQSYKNKKSKGGEKIYENRNLPKPSKYRT